MSSFLITGGDKKKRLEKIEELKLRYKIGRNSPDLITVSRDDAPSIGIGKIRELKNKARFIPYRDPYKAVVIGEAEKLTVEAQNALLRILEEPPEKTVIILEATEINSFLPTVISRCQILSLGQAEKTPIDANDQKYLESWGNLANSKSLKEKVEIAFPLAEEIATDKEKATIFLDKQTALLRDVLLEKTGVQKKTGSVTVTGLEAKKIIDILKLIKTFRVYISANVSPRLCLENLFLEI